VSLNAWQGHAVPIVVNGPKWTGATTSAASFPKALRSLDLFNVPGSFGPNAPSVNRLLCLKSV
jgi:hypothetical protein